MAAQVSGERLRMIAWRAYAVIALIAALWPVAARAADRVAPGTLQCDFEGWEGGERFDCASRNVRTVYDAAMNLSFFGSRATHEMLRTAFRDLTFHPSRTPIVSADMTSGRLHVFDCRSGRCSFEEIARVAPLACMTVLGTRGCMTFAVRVENLYLCTLMPGLNQ
jgi:hypothetical protein